MARTRPINVVQNSTAPSYTITCERDDGTVIDLTGTTVTLKLCRGTTQVNTGHESCVLSNPSSGVITWIPRTGDFSLLGKLLGDIKITYADATFETLFGQIAFKVRKAL